mgnify:CR=1 FL=1
MLDVLEVRQNLEGMAAALAARKVTEEEKEGIPHHLFDIKEIDDEDFKTEFRRLSEGVDENGQNVSLSTEEYENYQAAVEKLTDGHEELIKGYNEEGKAIIDRDKLLENSIALTKEQMRLEKQKMYGEEQLKNQGEELKEAMIKRIKEKDSNLVGRMETQGTTPRQLTDLIGSLCDLTSGSGDKGTPIILIQGYFDNFTTK